MPCPDKKLEAVRGKFFYKQPNRKVKFVDQDKKIEYKEID